MSVILAARFPDFVSNLFLIGYCPVVRGIGRQCAVALCGLLDCFDFTRGALQKLSFSWKESEVQLKRDPRFRAQPAFRDFSGAAVTLIGRLQTNARRAWKNVRVPAHFFHGALDGRAALRGVQRLVHKVRRSSGAELTIYPGSTHCIASGPEGPRFVSDFRRAIVQSLI